MWTEFLHAMQLGTVAQGGYQDGRAVDLRGVAHKPLYLVGDIHAKPARIGQLLQHSQLEPLLESEAAVLVFLGDLFHREDDARAGEMESSLETLEILARLKTSYPRSVYSLLGNHEMTRTESTKRGYFQGELFRRALQERELDGIYNSWLEASPLLVIHPRLVGVHAGPAVSAQSLEQLKQVPVRDVDPWEQEPEVRELLFTRHVDWSPNPSKSYSDYQIEDFLSLCGVAKGRLITGHTPLSRETAWYWDIGRHLTVIFAAGRELGYLKATEEGEEMVRVGRSLVDDDDTLLPDRWPDHVPHGTEETERGRRRIRLHDLERPVELLPDVLYRFEYARAALHLQLPDGKLRICQYRHLNAASQDYYEQGYYLVGDEFRQEIVRLKRDLAVLIGGSPLIEGVRVSSGGIELAVLRMADDGIFDLRPLVQGLVLGD